MIYSFIFEGLKGFSDYQTHIQVAHKVNLNYAPKVDDYLLLFHITLTAMLRHSTIIFPLSLADRCRENLKEDVISAANKLSNHRVALFNLGQT